MNKRTERKAERLNARLTFSDGETITADNVLLTTLTTIHSDGRGNDVVGLKETQVMLPEELPWERRDGAIDLTLSNGDTWKAITRDGRCLERTGA